MVTFALFGCCAGGNVVIRVCSQPLKITEIMDDSTVGFNTPGTNRDWKPCHLELPFVRSMSQMNRGLQEENAPSSNPWRIPVTKCQAS